MMWYMTAEPYRVSVLRIEVCDPGRTEWSRRRCTGPAFGKVLISPTSHGHLTLAVASRGSPCGAGGLGCSVCLWAYKWRPFYCLKHL